LTEYVTSIPEGSFVVTDDGASIVIAGGSPYRLDALTPNAAQTAKRRRMRRVTSK
jgi:hypothetical protein